ncbi:MAG: hypothetical protein AB1716_24905 [Planctomycetota bacterium]
MLIWLRSLLRFNSAQARQRAIQERLKAESLAQQELARAARGQNWQLEQMLRETQQAEQRDPPKRT